MLCNLCQSLFYGHLKPRYSQRGEISGKEAHYDYHPNLMSLEVSATTGCHLCVKILGALEPADRYEAYPRLRDATGDLALDRYGIRVKLNSNDFKDGLLTLQKLFFTFEYPDPLNQTLQKYVVVRCALMPEREARHFVVEEEVSSRTDSRHTFSQVSRWLTQCRENHTNCGPPPFHTQSWRPTRLLYIEPAGESPTLRLYEGDQIPQGVTYMTLSHCWGALPMITLTKNSLLEMKCSIPWTSLTKTFQDAINITRMLKISYLWIDSLCIVQDSSTDWDQESAIMGDIYRHSYCNISATGAPDGRSGCFIKRDPLLIEACKIRTKWTDETWTTLTCLFADFMSTGFQDEPLNQRAWVIQERLLAPRVLHFCTTQLIWECNELTASETAPLGFSHIPQSMRWIPPVRGRFSELVGITDGPALRTLVHHAWGYIVSVYSKCALTKETDKLVALSGLSKEVQGVLQDDYLAGLWRQNLECQLLWEVKNSCHGRRPTVYIAPSWSWASLWDASVFPDSWIQNPSIYKSLISIHQAWVTSGDNTQSQKLIDGTIILRGYLVPGFNYCSPDTLDVHNDKWKHPFRSNDIVSPDVRNTIQKQDGGVIEWRLPIKANELWYLPVRSDLEKSLRHKLSTELTGLVLQRIRPDTDEFFRLGTFRIKLKLDIDWFWQSCDRWEKTLHSNLDARALDSKLYDGVVQYDPLLREYKVADNVRQYTITLK